MIRGLEHFKKHFFQYGDNFIFIGGVASYLVLEKAGAPKIRATKDLDIVLIMKPTNSFLKIFRQYIKNGGYEIQQGENERGCFYRFQKPTNEDYPIMIELFAAIGSDFELFKNQRIIPVSTPEDVESLSAILLDNDYYSLIKNNTDKEDGVNFLNSFALIPFKAKAYLEIKERKEDSKNWKKHRSDIINLTVTSLSDEQKGKLKGRVRDHFVEFLRQLKDEITADMIKGACKQKVSSDEVILLLEKVFL